MIKNLIIVLLLVFSNNLILCRKSRIITSTVSLPNQYNVIGPFPIGQREQGIDTLEAYGGIFNIPIGDNTTYPSELGVGGKVGWIQYQSSSSGQFSIDFSNQMNWNFYQQVWGWVIWLWYGYAVGEFSVQQSGNYIMDCTSIRTYYIRSIGNSNVFYELQGDMYGYGVGQQSINLPQGNYQIIYRIQSSVRLNQSPVADFTCTIQSSPSNEVLVLSSESIMSDIVGGELASPYASITVLNVINTPIQNISISLQSTEIFTLKPYYRNLDGVPSEITLLPGQKLSIPIQLELNQGVNYECPSQLALNVITTSSDGNVNVLQTGNLTLNCTEWGNPFLYTFIDFDQTVQYAMAIPPSGECEQECNIMLALHGAGVEASSSSWFTAVPQQSNLWVVFPTGRRSWGYDWEGPSRRNTFSAINYLAENLPAVPNSLKSSLSIDPTKVLVVGHSMGGHGCWSWISNYGDLVMGAACAAGFVKIQHYVLYNTAPGYAFIDPVLQGLLMASIAENDVDLLTGNLVGLPLLARYGENDTNVNPWHSRRISRMVCEQSNNETAVIVNEVPNEGHWFNGILDDQYMQDYYSSVISQNSQYLSPIPKTIIISTNNPAVSGQRANILILQTVIPGRVARIRITQITQNGKLVWMLNTQNVARFQMNQLPEREEGLPVSLIIDGQDFETLYPPYHYYKLDKYAIQSWNTTDDETWPEYERSAYTYGPIRQIFEKPFTIVYGTNSSDETIATFMWAATYIANFWNTNGRGSAIIVQDIDFIPPENCTTNSNFILLGNSYENLITSKYSTQLPITFNPDNSFFVGPVLYSASSVGTSFIAPNECGQGLLLVVAGTDTDGFVTAVHTLPQISAITLPDFVVVGNEWGWKGAGGILAAGFWDSDWTFQPQCSYVSLNY